MTDDKRVAQIIASRGNDPDIMFLLGLIDVRSAVLGNLMEELDAMEPKPPFEAYSTSHARALSQQYLA